MRSPRLLQSNKEFLKDSCSDSHSSGPSQKRLVQGTQICVGEAHWLDSELGPGRGMLSRQKLAGVISIFSLSALFQLGRNFFLTLRFFFLSHSLFYFPIRHHLSSCPPSALLHPVDTISFPSFKFQASFSSLFLLDYKCHTMLCQFLLYNAVNQLSVHIYPLPLDLSPTHPHPSPWVITEHLS